MSCSACPQLSCRRKQTQNRKEPKQTITTRKCRFNTK
uniref:Uncharacterized protein n=1 Tax=Anguilla anguilla TaxID=7936 RepID=A0A0E9WCH4_ANGAN